MPIPPKVKKYLEQTKIKYKPIAHKTVYTAYDAAQTMKAKLNEIPKVLHVVADKKRHILVIVPASYNVDLAKLKKALRARKVEVATEKAMQKAFKIKAGALTAFGGLYKDADVFVDKAFTRARRVLASAGTLTDSLEIKTKDFLKATQGQVGQFGKPKKFKAPKKAKKVVKKPAKKRVVKKKVVKPRKK